MYAYTKTTDHKKRNAARMNEFSFVKLVFLDEVLSEKS